MDVVCYVLCIHIYMPTISNQKRQPFPCSFFPHCEQRFKFSFLGLFHSLFSFSLCLPTTAAAATTITKKAPNANGKWFQVATAHQIQPFISIQIYKQMLNTNTVRRPKAISIKQANKTGK